MSSISKDYVFKTDKETLKFIGDFEGLYKNDDNPWGQDGKDNRLGEYYKYSRTTIIKKINEYNNCKTMIEIGSGLGYVVDFINKHSHITCDGADISQTAIKKSKINFPTYNFINIDITQKLDKKNILNQTYDIVLLNQVLWYVLENMDIMFDNIFSMLNNKGGGEIFMISQSFLESQGYGKDIIDGFGGLIQYIENHQKQKFKIVEAQLINKNNLLYADGIIIMEKINE